MRKQTGYIVVMFGFMCLTGKAQDIHFSQFFNAPLINNPGNAGMIREDFRFGLNQRVQWRSVSDKPYNTLGLSAEMHAPFEINRLGVGLSVLNDITGDSRFRTFDVNVAAAYRFNLSSDSVHSLSAGFQLGWMRKTIDYSNLNFDSQYNGYAYDPSLGSNEVFGNQGQSFLNLNLGTTYRFNPGNRISGEFGAALFNIGRPKQSFFDESDVRRDRRLLLQLRGAYPIDLKWDLLPTFSFMFQGKYKEFIFGSLTRYTIVNERDVYRALYGGLLYRNSDAGYLFLGMDYDSWHVGLSYDLNVSNLTPASLNRGGWEVAVIYKLRYYKYKPVKHKVCPSYMK